MLKRRFAALAAAVGLCVLGAAAEPLPVPLVRAHAHNDYEHDRPLLDALDHGFCSVEADVHLVDGALLVAHDRDQCRPERTLEALYLEPLRQRTLEHGGFVYPGGPTVTLLIDIKSDAERTYAALHEQLAAYGDIFTEFRDGTRTDRAVVTLISGNRPFETIAAQSLRYAALDGRPPDLLRNPPADLYPLISASWGSLFRWHGRGAFPADQAERLGRLVAQCHDQGRRIRFWAIPQKDAFYEVMYEAGVDLINTDDLAGLQAFLLAKGGGDPVPLMRGHAHNDYANPAPLMQALENGFCSVEADFHLMDGELRIGHDAEDCRPGVTLESLYLAPLRKRVQDRGGRVYADGPTFRLLLDPKTGGAGTYAAIHDVLTRYADILTEYRGAKMTRRGAVTVHICGGPRAVMLEQPVRYAAVEGGLGDLDADPPVGLVPSVSASWRGRFRWTGRGPFPEEERRRLEALVARAHAQGRRIRFWALPGARNLRNAVYAAGVDWINCDNLPRARQFLLAKQQHEEGPARS